MIDKKVSEEIQKLEARRSELFDLRESNKITEKQREELRTNFAQLSALYRQHESDILTDLRAAGYSNIESVWDFVNTGERYPLAIPILIEHLSMPYLLRIKEGIVRALAVKEAKGIACKALIDEYWRTTQNMIVGEMSPIDIGYVWAIGNTISVVITKDYVDDVIEILRDSKSAGGRSEYCVALRKMKSPKSREILEQLVHDEDSLTAKEAVKALAKIK